MSLAKKRFEVNLTDENSLSNTLDLLIENLDEVCKMLKKTDYFEYKTEFGITKNHQFYEHKVKEKFPVIWEEILYTSELAFFIEAVKHKNCIHKVITYVDKIIAIHTKECELKFWENSKILKGLYPAFALVYQDKKYTDKLIIFIRITYYDVYQYKLILLLLKKWGFNNDEMIKLGAAKSTNVCCGINFLGKDITLTYTGEEKKTLFYNLMEDYYYKGYIDKEIFYEIIPDDYQLAFIKRKKRFEVNLTDENSISSTLILLIENLKEIPEMLKKTDEIYYETVFGITKNNQFYEHKVKELFPTICEEILYTSELAFFLEAVKHKNCIHKVISYVDKIIEMQFEVGPYGFWENEEIEKGLYPAFALVYQDKKYIDKFIKFLRSINIYYHEEYHSELIFLLTKKWGFKNNEMLKLVAVRTLSIGGQCTLEDWSKYPTFTEEQKKTIFYYLMEDYLYSEYNNAEDFYEKIKDDTQLSLDKEKLMKLLENDKPKSILEKIKR